MRTTVDLPEALLRRVKAGAALRGMKMKDFMAVLIERSLSSDSATRDESASPSRRLPTMIPATGRKIPIYSNSELFAVLDEADMTKRE